MLDLAANKYSERPSARTLPLATHLVVLFATLAALFASPAMAASAPMTRLVRCDAGSCLLVSGHRTSAATAVRINGHAVQVEGRRNWQARLPVATVRSWSVPFARTIDVTLHDASTQAMSSEPAQLPIGLMGHVDLASLVVSIH